MKFEHTATLMAHSAAIARDRNQRAWAKTMPVPSERDKQIAEFESRNFDVSAPHEPLDRIEFELFREDPDQPVNLFPHDRPLFWLTTHGVEKPKSFLIHMSKERAERIAKLAEAGFIAGYYTMRDFCDPEA